ncbi:MAG TPA: YraN family protein, partial [bacterium]|nr:YraN family protein [bacterium]
MTAPHLEVGAEGEAEAVDFLLARGWEIVARNVRYDDVGELDIVAAKDDVLAFVEVKTRSIADEFDPTIAMNHRKMRKFVNAARA